MQHCNKPWKRYRFAIQTLQNEGCFGNYISLTVVPMLSTAVRNALHEGKECFLTGDNKHSFHP